MTITRCNKIMYTWKKLKIIKVRIKGNQRREIYKAGKQKLSRLRSQIMFL